MEQTKEQKTSIIIGASKGMPLVRASFAHLLAPKKAPGSDKEKYSVSIVFSKKDVDLKKRIDAAVQAALVAKFGDKFKGKLKMPVRDGDAERPGDAVYAGNWFVNATSEMPPEVVDLKLQPIITASEIYSGMYVRVSVNFFGFDVPTQKGVACGLNNVQKVKDGEVLSGRKAAADDFNDDFTFEDDAAGEEEDV